MLDLNRNKSRINIEGNKGSALVLVIIILSLFIILAAGLSTITNSSYRYNINESNSLKVFYIAEACLEETRVRVIMGLQTFIDTGSFNQNQFNIFLNELPSIIGEVTQSEVIENLRADSIKGDCRIGSNSCLFSYTVTMENMSQTLYAKYLFYSPETYMSGDRATEKIEIVWGFHMSTKPLEQNTLLVYNFRRQERCQILKMQNIKGKR